MQYPQPSEHIRLIDSVLAGDREAIAQMDPAVRTSWQRCTADYQLDPLARREPVVIAHSDLNERQERLARLLALAKNEMTSLYQQVAGSGYAILLTDMDGVILNYVGDPLFTNAAARSGLQNGAVWSEEAQGTNGMGTCIIECRPLVVHKEAHFLAQHTGLTCSAAPIVDPRGKTIAILDASSESSMAQQHTMVLVNMSAQTIENRLFLCAFRNDFILRFHSRPEFVSTLGEGALAFDGSGNVLGANRSALFQLGLKCDNVLGQSLSQVFDTTLDALLALGRRQSFHPTPIHTSKDGRRFFGIVQLPEAALKTPAPVSRRDSSEGRPQRERTTTAGFEHLESSDAVIAENIRRARMITDRDIPLLIYGETGTGKGVFAKAFHDGSVRQGKPFIAVNCASIPESLIESELFGYRPGAFTGANRKGSRGKIAQANGGSLFLDEIGDMPLALQARLLRVLEEKEVVPLGGETPEKVDVNIISATHRSLPELMESGRFREDLFYRLHGMSITMPALRARTDKRELIAKLLWLEQNRANVDATITHEALEILARYSWPGNIRQLCNVLRTLVALCGGKAISVDDLPPEVKLPTVLSAPNEQTIEQVEPETPFDDPLSMAECTALLRELEALRWNIAKAARKLGLSRNTLYRKMKRYGIKPPR